MPEHVFLTGATGMLGRILLPRLLRALPEAAVTLLLRAADDQDLRARIHSLRQECALAGADGRLSALRGDVTLDRLGLTERDWNALRSSVTHIIHGAATIRFDHPLEEARAINAGGTRRVLDLAEACKEHGPLKRFLYIGTSSVSGRSGGLISEGQLEVSQEFFNTYERSKCESERLVRDRFSRLPAIVVRPSIVIGDSVTGRTSSFNVIYIPLRLVYRGLLTVLPAAPETLMDLVPVDWVCDALLHILGAPITEARVFHLTAGPQRAVRLVDLVESAIDYFDRVVPLSRRRKIRFVSTEEYEGWRETRRGREQKVMEQLDTLLPYVTVNRLFDTANTDRILAGSGIRFPSFADYAGRIYGYCLDSNWGKKRN